MENIKVEVNNEASRYIEVVDVRIRRADLPEANSQAIYERMISKVREVSVELKVLKLLRKLEQKLIRKNCYFGQLQKARFKRRAIRRS